MSIAAWYLIKKKHIDFAQRAFKIGLVVALISAYSQLFYGSKSADIVEKYQPAKLAAMEGHYDTLSRAHLYLFGWVDKKAETTKGIYLPGGLSFLVHQDFNAPIRGLKSFPVADRPTSPNIVFQSYHIMIAIGVVLIALTTLAGFLLWKKKLFDKKWLMVAFVWAVALPQIANQTGWYTAETGRQPWVVYGLLRTSNALSQSVTKNQVIFSLVLFTAVYVLLFVLFIYLLNKKIIHGPEGEGESTHNPRQQEMTEVFDDAKPSEKEEHDTRPNKNDDDID